jgi:hypothetical protein
MECKPEGRRSFGRPRLRWKDGVEDDLRKLNVKTCGRSPRTGNRGRSF